MFLIKCGIDIPQNYWNYVAISVIYFPWINYTFMILRTTKARGTFQQERNALPDASRGQRIASGGEPPADRVTFSNLAKQEGL